MIRDCNTVLSEHEAIKRLIVARIKELEVQLNHRIKGDEMGIRNNVMNKPDLEWSLNIQKKLHNSIDDYNELLKKWSNNE